MSITARAHRSMLLLSIWPEARIPGPGTRGPMTTILHWVGRVLGLLLVAVAILGFWRGLSLRPSEPGSRAPERLWWWAL
jgi:hypothetical protein